MKEKLAHFDEQNESLVHKLLVDHDEIIEIALEAIRLASSKIETCHSFPLTKNNPLSEKDRLLSPVHNQIIRDEVYRTLKVGITSPTHSEWALLVVMLPRKTLGLDSV